MWTGPAWPLGPADTYLNPNAIVPDSSRLQDPDNYGERQLSPSEKWVSSGWFPFLTGVCFLLCTPMSLCEEGHDLENVSPEPVLQGQSLTATMLM